MRHLPSITRLALGALFILFGVDGFAHFLPVPDVPTEGREFLRVLERSGYLRIVQLVEIAGGLLLVSGWRVPLGLLVLAPILVNILIFHALFDPVNAVPALLLTALWCVTCWGERDAFQPILGPS